MNVTLGTVIEFIQAIGFPIFVAVWLLIRTEAIMREMTSALKEMREVLIKLNGKR